MKDTLQELCISKNIELIYTNNDFTILSSSFKDNIPSIKAHNIFRNCSKEVSRAIIDYYTNSSQKKYNLRRVICEYAEDYFTFTEFEIKPPNEAFTNVFAESKNPVGKTIEKPAVEFKQKKVDDSSNLVELDVLSITNKDFWGNTSDMNPDDTIKASTDNIVDLDIVVNKFNM